MAGVDTEFLGEAFPAKKMKVGYLEQEPQLDETLNVRDNIFAHMGDLPKFMKEYNAINDKFWTKKLSCLLMLYAVQMPSRLSRTYRAVKNAVWL